LWIPGRGFRCRSLFAPAGCRRRKTHASAWGFAFEAWASGVSLRQSAFAKKHHAQVRFCAGSVFYKLCPATDADHINDNFLFVDLVDQAIAPTVPKLDLVMILVTSNPCWRRYRDFQAFAVTGFEEFFDFGAPVCAFFNALGRNLKAIAHPMRTSMALSFSLCAFR